MRFPLRGAARKTLVLAPTFLVCAAYIALVSAQYLATRFSDKTDLASLQKAVFLEPGNAEYYHRAGLYYYYSYLNDPGKAAEWYRSAVALNPHRARYWFDLASAYAALGGTAPQQDALDHAVAAEPKSPQVLWEAANFHLAQGENGKALEEFRVVMQSDLNLFDAALEDCWRIEPDAKALLRDVVPANVQSLSQLLNFLIAKSDQGGAAEVWGQLVRLGTAIERQYVFRYVQFLIQQRDIRQARLVWRQAAALGDLSAYQPSAENLVVNGDFSLAMLNGGFDWLYESSPDASLALDSTEAHLGHRALLIAFDSRGTEDAGIRQYIPATPDTEYEFSSFFKTGDLQGAGGPRFVIQDAYNGAIYFAGDEMKNADFWKPVDGSFRSGQDTTLLLLRIQRFPPGNAIRGKLWIDGVRLVQKGSGVSH
jgi:tetratricopeptide (TPR) repeat protein